MRYMRDCYTMMQNTSASPLFRALPKGAFYIFINIEKLGMSGQEFAPLLLENAKVAMVPGDVFGSEGDHYIRMSFANSYENVVEGFKRLKEFVEKIRK